MNPNTGFHCEPVNLSSNIVKHQIDWHTQHNCMDSRQCKSVDVLSVPLVFLFFFFMYKGQEYGSECFFNYCWIKIIFHTTNWALSLQCEPVDVFANLGKLQTIWHMVNRSASLPRELVNVSSDLFLL